MAYSVFFYRINLAEGKNSNNKLKYGINLLMNSQHPLTKSQQETNLNTIYLLVAGPPYWRFLV